MTETEVNEQIREFVLESLARREGIMNFADGDSLLENGVITSIGIYRLVMFFEENFHIHVPDDDLVPDHLDLCTLATIDQKQIAVDHYYLAGRMPIKRRNCRIISEDRYSEHERN